MSRFSRRISIEAPLPTVWAALVDVETWPAWASQFARIERLGSEPFALGSQVRVTPKGMPSSTWTVTEYEEGRSFTWAASLGPGVRIVGGHELGTSGDATTAEFWLQAEGPVGRALAPILRRTIFSRNTRNATEGLKQHVERRGAPPER